MKLDGAQIHLLLNHVPVIGSVGILLILLAAVLRRSDEYTRLALAFAVAVALVTIPVLRSGDPAEDRIRHQPGVTERWIAPHERMAKISSAVMLLFGAVAALALGTARKGRPLARWVTPTALVLAIATSVLMGITAHRGGMVRHIELRPGYVPLAGGRGATRDSALAPGEAGETGERGEAGERR